MTRAILFSLILLSFHLQANERPRVLVSIKPLHSLVAALLVDVTEPDLLLDGRQSPHDYQMRPSDAAKLAAADVIIWVGPALESFMHRQLAKAGGKTIIRLADIGRSAGPSTRLHAGRYAHGQFRADGEADPLARLHANPHRWLDPRLAKADMLFIAAGLIRRYPHLKLKISKNIKPLVARLNDLDRDMELVFSQQREALSAVLYHDAWWHFTKRFHLDVHGIVSPSAHRQPGPRHLDRIIQTIETNKTRCLLIEPQFRPKYIDTIKERFQMKVLKIDPLGANQAAGTDAYFNMMRANTKVFAQCR